MSGTVRVLYEITQTKVAVIDEPDGSYEELLAAVQRLEDAHTHVRLVNWYTLREKR